MAVPARPPKPKLAASIDEARSRIARIIKDSPSLESFPGEALADAYRSALRDRDINYLDTRDVPKDVPGRRNRSSTPNFCRELRHGGAALQRNGRSNF